MSQSGFSSAVRTVIGPFSPEAHDTRQVWLLAQCLAQGEQSLEKVAMVIALQVWLEPRGDAT